MQHKRAGSENLQTSGHVVGPSSLEDPWAEDQEN